MHYPHWINNSFLLVTENQRWFDTSILQPFYDFSASRFSAREALISLGLTWTPKVYGIVAFYRLWDHDFTSSWGLGRGLGLSPGLQGLCF